GLPRRQRRDTLADVPPGRRIVDRRARDLRRSERRVHRFPAAVLRARRPERALSSVVLPVHRAVCGDRHGLRRRLAGNLRRGPGASERVACGGDRSRALSGFRLRHGPGPARDAALRRRRSALVLRKRFALPAPVRMKFSEHWLRTLVDPPIDSETLAERLTMAGLEVEERATVARPFSGVVVGRVLAVARHPNADRLTVCQVDVGRGAPLSIVCGAPNAAPGITVPCALPGAALPGGLAIKKTAMRGVESDGMLCSAVELGLSDDASGLAVLEPDLKPGMDLRAALDLDDALLTLKLTPNRADCLSLVGVAREVAAITGAALKPPPAAPVAIKTQASRRVRVEDALACLRFCGRLIEGIDPKAPTPEWMRRRLERSGIRSISAVVDVTNYVMLELGQPLHAYDDRELEGDIVVRFARRDEKLTLLNGQTLDLDPDVLLVADEKKPLGLAGIMGGEHSGIGDATRNVFLEGAFWNTAVIQGKARRLGFTTDAGFRFDRGVDFANAPAAVERATQLIVELCGGAAGPLVDVRGELPRRDPVRVRGARIARLLGVAIPAQTVAGIFERLKLEPRREGEDFVCTPPSFRFDLAIEEDFIEEVARLHGYDNIPSAPPVQPQTMLPQPEAMRPSTELRQRLVDRDYQEAITFSFVDSGWERALGIDANPIRVLNPIASPL